MGRRTYLPAAFIPVLFLLASCGAVPKGSFGHDIPAVPDYSDASNWAALPDRKDYADEVPVAEWKDAQGIAQADVFFIHPTTYTGKPGQNEWNASVSDQKLNTLTDKYPIRYQATVLMVQERSMRPDTGRRTLIVFLLKKLKMPSKPLTWRMMMCVRPFNIILIITIREDLLSLQPTARAPITPSVCCRNLWMANLWRIE